MSLSLKIRPLLMIVPVLVLGACAQGPLVEGGPNAPAAGKSGTLGRNAPATDLGSINEPSRLKGLTPVQVQQVLGQPGFLRQDAPAEIWQYRGRACILDLYIYDQGNGRTVDHWAVRSPARLNDADCFQQLVEQGHPHVGS